jgi:hypothetical protein
VEVAPPEHPKTKARPLEERHPRVAPPERSAYLSLDATEPMNVSIDGTPAGTVPLHRYKLSPGEHRVRLDNRVLGVSRTIRVALRPGEELSRKEAFAKGRLNVSSQPWADVFVDGKKLGTTPLAARELWEGRHAVRLVGAQGEKTITVEVVAGQTAVVKETIP